MYILWQLCSWYLLELILIKSLCSTSYWIDKSGKFSSVIVFRLPMRHFRRNKVLVLHLFKETSFCHGKFTSEYWNGKLNWRRHICLSNLKSLKAKIHCFRHSAVGRNLKFGYSEKATKYEKIFHVKFDFTE